MNQNSTVIASRLLGLGAVALVLGLTPVGFAKVTPTAPAKCVTATSSRIVPAPVVLTDAEKADLAFMREEEKVARDAYLYFYGAWGEVVFSNIAKSEQSHMNALGKLLAKYGVSDPVAGLGVGQFSTPEFQAMYDEVVALGSVSFADALTMGVLIEEADIADLNSALSETTVKDITTVYKNLLSGSLKHLAAFNAWLALQAVAD